MSAVYPKFRENLVTWALNGGGPVTSEFRVRGLNNDYVYSDAHDSLGDVVASTPYVTEEIVLENVTVTNGILDADNVDFAEQTLGETLQAILVYLWDTTAEVGYPAAYINSSTDATLPQLIEQVSGQIRWNPAGICKF